MALADDLRVRIAVGANLVVAAVGVGAALLSIVEGGSGFYSPTDLSLGAAVVLLCAWRLSRDSLAAMLILAVVHVSGVASFAALSIDLWSSVVAGFALPLTLQAAPSIWRLRRSKPPTRSPFLTSLGATLGLSMLGAFVWFAGDLSRVPPTRILPGAQVPGTYAERFLALNAIAAPDERIIYFYSPGFQFDSEFYLLTSGHVVAFAERWDPPLHRIAYSEVAEIEVNYSDTWLEDSVIYVTDHEGLELAIPISPEAGGTGRFASELRRQWAMHGGREQER